MSREFIIGGYSHCLHYPAATYVTHDETRDFIVVASQLAAPPSAGPPPTGGLMKVWTGSAWVEKPVKVWTGSAWVTKPVKFWNGSSWVLS